VEESVVFEAYVEVILIGSLKNGRLNSTSFNITILPDKMFSIGSPLFKFDADAFKLSGRKIDMNLQAKIRSIDNNGLVRI
jgi:hypothetical protein